MVFIIWYFVGYVLVLKWLEYKIEYFEGLFYFLFYVFIKLIYWCKIFGDMKVYIIVFVSFVLFLGNICLDCNRRYLKCLNKRK